MAIKKSDLYPKLWASCDELRGGVDAIRCKDGGLVLFLPFAKDINDQADKKITPAMKEANWLCTKAEFSSWHPRLMSLS